MPRWFEVQTVSQIESFLQSKCARPTVVALALFLLMPVAALAQGSPFDTGFTARRLSTRKVVTCHKPSWTERESYELYSENVPNTSESFLPAHRPAPMVSRRVGMTAGAIRAMPLYV